MKKIPPYGAYPVITGRFCRNGSSVGTLRKVLKGGARMVQLREKEMQGFKLLQLAKQYRAYTRKSGAILIINDRIDIALACGADGVHLGQQDMPCGDAKRIAPGLLVGISTHNMEEAAAAVKAGADYINIGPVFGTKTKQNSVSPLGPGAVKRISSGLKVPFTVMGGIKQSNIEEVLRAGARRVAMVTEITEAEDPEKKTRELNGIIRKFLC